MLTQLLIQTTTFLLQSQVPSSVTGSLFSHRYPLQSQVPSSVTGSLFSHRFPLQSQVSSIGHKEGTQFTIGTCVTPLSYRLAMGLNNADPVTNSNHYLPSSVTGSLFSHRFRPSDIQQTKYMDMVVPQSTWIWLFSNSQSHPWW